MSLGTVLLLTIVWFFLPRGFLSKAIGGFLAIVFFRQIVKVFLCGLIAVFVAAAMTLGPERTLRLFTEMGHEIAVTF